METVLNDDVLNSFAKFAPYLTAFLEAEASFAITDTEKFIKFIPSENIHPDIKEGLPINKGSSTEECLRNGQTVSKVVPKEVFGFEMKSIAAPIRNQNGDIIGTVSIGKSLKQRYEVLNLSKNLSQALQQISSAINEISTGVQNLVSTTRVISEAVEHASSEAAKSDDILQFVKNVADQTNLLGLNAAIEAARAGEAGRGFSIVAQEIRKLSNSSNQSIDQIKIILDTIQSSITTVKDNINAVSTTFQEQASALQEVTASVEELTSNSNVLEDIASKF